MFMIMNARPIPCPLCGEEVPAAQLYDHKAADNRAAVEYTINVIKDKHPEWTEHDPACQRCWDYYRTL
jgi:hypothetical protein